MYPQPNNTPNEQDSVKEVNALIGNERFLVQQFIPLDLIDQKKYDIRIYVQKDHQGQWTVSGGFSRVVGSADSYITNQATEIKSIHDMLKENNMLSTNQLDKMEKISIQAAQAIEYKLGHLGEMAVDFGLDHQGNPWIIEVNGRTQKKFVKRVNDSELTRTIYLKPIEYARFLARSPRKK
ncbi:D-alanine-D-alanine ligase-like ATP-grasp enzyme [Caldalkalibacillus uzonensis]|uniref:D-alanine-D-alanine ligase-like ATP-grasp enzyme n=1 Tax=Caldalkalibacillus uzonensis TaxID=353224 RepID=A0ABU0CRH9_9BACI|nr:YheC/YheD family protein [Caldalkalibacillus uzonensis]MDQ0339026.1 D-alanine-D-alanine ligase-like ATP-grasp enzyme [Caldalkalibacillus uzonensis]